MATVKKKKGIIITCIVLVVAIAAGSIFAVASTNSGKEVSLYTIGTDDIDETVSLTGDVSSGAEKEYKVSTVATVKEVFVSVGDEVKQGDVLATFDTDSLDSEVQSLQDAYNDVKSSYNDAVEAQETAKEKADEINTKIEKLEKKITKLEKKLNTTTKVTTKKKTTTKKSTTTTTKSSNTPSSLLSSTTTTAAAKETTTTTTTTTVDDGSAKWAVNASAYPSSAAGSVTGGGVFSQSTSTQLVATPADGYNFFGWYTSTSSILASSDPISTSKTVQLSYDGSSVVNYYAVFVSTSDTNSTEVSLNDLVTTLQTLSDNIASITDDVETMTTLTQVIASSISSAISSGQLNSETIAELVAEDIAEAIQQGIIDSAKLLVEEDAAVELVQTAVASIDFSSLASSVADSDNATLTSSQIQLAALYAQYEIYNALADDTLIDTQEAMVEAAKSALETMQEQQAEMKEGWKAAFDGVITSVDITSGGSTSALSAGIVLENMDTMVATVSLGEYDLHKVKVGMTATITTAYGTYEGEVATIAPIATGGSDSSLLDSVGSMAGISGLSSLTESGAGVKCTVTINNTDENITVGFDANVEIQTGYYEGVTVVPNESIKMEKTGSYVYLYNEEDSTVTKTLIETGAISDTCYEVTSGLEPGDKVVAAPSSDYEEDTFDVKVVSES
ncbi:MAG: biotin/lipoyl-binding protein [Clostridiales bacterium]|nr:biotin/lipoyl-binding protein [Clostridiales bacterium]